MTYTLRFLPDVEDDAISGYSWYETKASGLGEDHPSFIKQFIMSLDVACSGAFLMPFIS
jgi:hypothetical protein